VTVGSTGAASPPLPARIAKQPKETGMDIVSPYFWLCVVFISGGVGIAILATTLPRIERESWW
jgi:hypothetical protein